jgi:hypothetical protein
MIENQNIEEHQAEALKIEFESTLSKCLRTFDTPFVNPTLNKPRQSVAYYDMIMYSFRELDDEFIDNYKTELNEKFIELCGLVEFQKTLAGGLQLKTSILKRRELWGNKIAEINGD